MISYDYCVAIFNWASFLLQLLFSAKNLQCKHYDNMYFCVFTNIAFPCNVIDIRTQIQV